MSPSVGVCRPFSSLETLEAGQDSDAASRLPVSPACRRSSRSRSPRARRPSWTLVTLLVLFDGKVIRADGPVPGRVPPVIAGRSPVLEGCEQAVELLADEQAQGSSPAPSLTAKRSSSLGISTHDSPSSTLRRSPRASGSVTVHPCTP